MPGRTPVYGITYPDGATKMVSLGAELGAMANGLEAALTTAAIPLVTPQPTMVAPSAAARDAHYGTPQTAAQRAALQRSGATCVRTDTGWTERYYDLWNADTNPGGDARGPGWYPVAGRLPVREGTIVPINGWSLGSEGASFRTFNGYTDVRAHLVRPQAASRTVAAILPAGARPVNGLHWFTAAASPVGEVGLSAAGELAVNYNAALVVVSFVFPSRPANWASD